jgi:hypothetical protein
VKSILMPVEVHCEAHWSVGCLRRFDHWFHAEKSQRSTPNELFEKVTRLLLLQILPKPVTVPADLEQARLQRDRRYIPLYATNANACDVGGVEKDDQVPSDSVKFSFQVPPVYSSSHR